MFPFIIISGYLLKLLVASGMLCMMHNGFTHGYLPNCCKPWELTFDMCFCHKITLVLFQRVYSPILFPLSPPKRPRPYMRLHKFCWLFGPIWREASTSLSNPCSILPRPRTSLPAPRPSRSKRPHHWPTVQIFFRCPPSAGSSAWHQHLLFWVSLNLQHIYGSQCKLWSSLLALWPFRLWPLTLARYHTRYHEKSLLTSTMGSILSPL